MTSVSGWYAPQGADMPGIVTSSFSASSFFWSSLFLRISSKALNLASVRSRSALKSLPTDGLCSGGMLRMFFIRAEMAPALLKNLFLASFRLFVESTPCTDSSTCLSISSMSFKVSWETSVFSSIRYAPCTCSAPMPKGNSCCNMLRSKAFCCPVCFIIPSLKRGAGNKKRPA